MIYETNYSNYSNYKTYSNYSLYSNYNLSRQTPPPFGEGVRGRGNQWRCGLQAAPKKAPLGTQASRLRLDWNNPYHHNAVRVRRRPRLL